MLPIQRRFTALFSGERWTPLVPVLQSGVFASLWEDQDLRLWTLVNRTRKTIEGTLLQVPAVPEHRYFDLVAGREIQMKSMGNDILLSGAIPARGIGCFLSGPTRELGAGFESFLRRQARLDAGKNFGTTTPRASTELIPVRPSRAQYASAGRHVGDCRRYGGIEHRNARTGVRFLRFRSAGRGRL